MGNLANSLTGIAIVQNQRKQNKLAEQMLQMSQADIARLQQEAYNAGYARGHYDGWHQHAADNPPCTCCWGKQGCKIHGGQFGGDA